MDELRSLGLGLVLGLVLISLLSIFPGEPFDYSTTNSSDDAKRSPRKATLPAAAGSEEAAGHSQSPPKPHPASADVDAVKASQCSPASPSKHTQAPNSPLSSHETEKERHKTKIKKLQVLLGLEKHKMDELVARTQAGTPATCDTTSNSEESPATTSFSGTRTYGAYLDYSFYAATLLLLAYVLKTEYDIDVTHLLAYLFPREVETAAQVLHTPMQFLQQLAAGGS